MRADRAPKFWPASWGEFVRELVVPIGVLVVGYIAILKFASIYLYGINFAQETHRLLLYLGVTGVASFVVTLVRWLAYRSKDSN